MSTHAQCTWGDGPDVLVVIGRDVQFGLVTFDVMHPLEPNAGSFGLTAKAARELAADLVRAAKEVERLSREASK